MLKPLCFFVMFWFRIQVNSRPYESGWIMKVEVSDAGEVNSLMDADQYSKFCEEEDAKH